MNPEKTISKKVKPAVKKPEKKAVHDAPAKRRFAWRCDDSAVFRIIEINSGSDTPFEFKHIDDIIVNTEFILHLMNIGGMGRTV